MLRYLGPYKVATIAGLRIVVFDDLRAAKCDALIQEINSSDGDVDLLLTADWPTDVLTGAPATAGAHILCTKPSDCEAGTASPQCAMQMRHLCVNDSRATLGIHSTSSQTLFILVQ
jgi:hypothetical protein